MEILKLVRPIETKAANKLKMAATNVMQAMRKADVIEKTESYGKYKFVKL